MPVLYQVRVEGSGIQNPLKLLNFGFHWNDGKTEEANFKGFIKYGI